MSDMPGPAASSGGMLHDAVEGNLQRVLQATSQRRKVLDSSQELLDYLEAISEAYALKHFAQMGIDEPMHIRNNPADRIFDAMRSHARLFGAKCEVYYLWLGVSSIPGKECLYMHHAHEGVENGLLVCKLTDGTFLAYNVMGSKKQYLPDTHHSASTAIGSAGPAPSQGCGPCVSVGAAEPQSGAPLRLVDQCSFHLPEEADNILLWPNGTSCVVAYKSRVISVIDTTSGRLINSLDLATKCERIVTLNVSSDGAAVAVSCWSPNCVRIFDGELQREIGAFEIPTGFPVDSLDFTRDGKHLLASGLNVETIHVWDMATRNMKHSFRPPRNPDCSAFCGGPNRVLVSCALKILLMQLPQETTGIECGRLEDVTGIAASPDGRHFLSWSWREEEFVVWNATNGEATVFPSPENSSVEYVEFTSDGQSALVLARNGIAVIDVASKSITSWFEIFDVDILGMTTARWLDGNRDRIILMGRSFHETKPYPFKAVWLEYQR